MPEADQRGDTPSVDRDVMGWPVRRLDGERVCARAACTKGKVSVEHVRANIEAMQAGDYRYPPAEEFRINGYCSHECEDMDELEELIALQARRLEALEAENDAYASCADMWAEQQDLLCKLEDVAEAAREHGDWCINRHHVDKLRAALRSLDAVPPPAPQALPPQP